jgi:hypothetical protein
MTCMEQKLQDWRLSCAHARVALRFRGAAPGIDAKLAWALTESQTRADKCCHDNNWRQPDQAPIGRFRWLGGASLGGATNVKGGRASTAEAIDTSLKRFNISAKLQAGMEMTWTRQARSHRCEA